MIIVVVTVVVVTIILITGHAVFMICQKSYDHYEVMAITTVIIFIVIRVIMRGIKNNVFLIQIT